MEPTQTSPRYVDVSGTNEVLILHDGDDPQSAGPCEGSLETTEHGSGCCEMIDLTHSDCDEDGSVEHQQCSVSSNGDRNQKRIANEVDCPQSTQPNKRRKLDFPSTFHEDASGSEMSPKDKAEVVTTSPVATIVTNTTSGAPHDDASDSTRRDIPVNTSGTELDQQSLDESRDEPQASMDAPVESDATLHTQKGDSELKPPTRPLPCILPDFIPDSECPQNLSGYVRKVGSLGPGLYRLHQTCYSVDEPSGVAETLSSGAPSPPSTQRSNLDLPKIPKKSPSDFGRIIRERSKACSAAAQQHGSADLDAQQDVTKTNTQTQAAPCVPAGDSNLRGVPQPEETANALSSTSPSGTNEQYQSTAHGSVANARFESIFLFEKAKDCVARRLNYPYEIKQKEYVKFLSEDASFVSNDCVAVFDGVGQGEYWSGVFARNLEEGVRKSQKIQFADSLAKLAFAHNYAVQEQVRLVNRGTHILYENTDIMSGSSTATLLSLKGTLLQEAVLGDSQWALLRRQPVTNKFEVIYLSQIIMHPTASAQAAPYQLNARDAASLRGAHTGIHHVQTGDIVVAGTDGLFDNLLARSMNRLVKDKDNIMRQSDADVSDIKNFLAQVANKASGNAQEMGRMLSNHVEQVIETAGIATGPGRQGCKPDDVTICVASISTIRNGEGSDFILHIPSSRDSETPPSRLTAPVQDASGGRRPDKDNRKLGRVPDKRLL